MKRLLSSLSVLALLTSPALYAQAPCALKKDINATVIQGGSSSPFASRENPGNTFKQGSWYVKCGKLWFFTATCTNSGRELWACSPMRCVSPWALPRRCAMAMPLT